MGREDLSFQTRNHCPSFLQRQSDSKFLQQNLECPWSYLYTSCGLCRVSLPSRKTFCWGHSFLGIFSCNFHKEVHLEPCVPGRMQAVWMPSGSPCLVLPRNARIQKQQYLHGICHQRCRESKRVGCGVNYSQNCFRSTSKVFFRSRVSQQLLEDTTHPKLGVGTKLNNQLISVWLPEPP